MKHIFKPLKNIFKNALLIPLWKLPLFYRHV